MMESLRNASPAIILGYKELFILYSYLIVSATCFGPEKSQCGNCPTGNDEHRTVVDTTFCVCEDKFYDDGSTAIC